jgi:diacylglycerol kinase
MENFLKSFGWAKNGLVTVWGEERNFKVEVIIGILAIGFGFYRDIAPWQWILLVMIIGFVLMAEIVNTAVEDICNKIQPNQDPIIGKIKDMMAGYVLVSSVTAAIAGLVLFFL